MPNLLNFDVKKKRVVKNANDNPCSTLNAFNLPIIPINYTNYVFETASETGYDTNALTCIHWHY